MSLKYGLEGKLYVGTAGSTPATELAIIGNVTLNLDAKEVDETTRASGRWTSTGVAHKNASVDWEMNYDTAATGFSTVQAAFLAGTAVAIAIRDGAGGHGPDADWVITKFARSEPLDGKMTVAVTAKVNCAIRAPAWL